MKNFFIKIFALLIMCTIFLTNTKVANATDFPYLEAQGVVLMDGNSGEVIFSKNPHTQFEPASTTKVATALVVLDNTELSDKVTIGANPPLVDGSAIGIREGEVYTIEELLLGLLLESGNDCAEALAEYVAGSNAEFAKLMTEKAISLGATDTTFKNPSGLSEDGHLTTAYDLALIMRAAANNPEFVKISRTESYFYKDHPFSDGTEKWATNRNNCYVEWSPYYYENLFCGKTGWTPEANHTYTAAAKKDNQMLVSAYLNAFDKDAQYSNVGALFDWGFENFTTTKLISYGDVVDEIKINDDVTIPLLATKDVYYTFSNSENINLDSITTDITYPSRDLSKTSFKKGDILFNATIMVNGTEFDSIELASGINRVYENTEMVQDIIISFFSNKLVIIFAILIIILIVIYYIRYVSKRKKFKERQLFIRRKHFNNQ